MYPQQQTLTPVNMNDCLSRAMLIATDSYSASPTNTGEPWLMTPGDEPLCCS